MRFDVGTEVRVVTSGAFKGRTGEVFARSHTKVDVRFPDGKVFPFWIHELVEVR